MTSYMILYTITDTMCGAGRAGYRCAHPVLRWLPTKLAEWIVSNLCKEMYIHPKQGAMWTVAELNAILIHNVVGGSHSHLRTFGCIQWECELFQGRPKARCYPFDIPGHCFRNKTPKVHATNNLAQICS